MIRQDYSIGEASRIAACKVQTIRYYEQTGLMPEPFRTQGNQRRYDEASLRRLAFIRHSRALGFSIADIRELLSLTQTPEQTCQSADAIARKHLAAVEKRMQNLAALKGELTRMISQCAGGKVAECRILEVLSDHNQCISDH